MQKMINSNELMALMVRLSFRGSEIMRRIKETNMKDIQIKGVDTLGMDDPVTEADLQIQQMIVGEIRKKYDGLQIIGEESIEPKENYTYEDKHYPQLDQRLFEGDNEQLECSRCILWIDPLDGTRNYVKDNLDCVTTLIGVSYDSRPIMGLITQHYQNNQFDPICYFSHTNQSQIYSLNYDGKQEMQVIKPSENKKKPMQEWSAVCTNTRYTDEMKRLLEEVLGVGQVIKQGGCGKKILSVIQGQADLYIYNQNGTKKWDTCSGEVLIEIMGGVLTGMNGQLYEYRDDQIENKEGLLVALDPSIIDDVLSKCQ